MLLPLLLLLAFVPVTDPPPDGTLRIAVTNIRQAGGTLWVGVYTGEDDFLDRHKARLVPIRVTTTGRQYIEIDSLVAGEDYALGLFHDVNDNGEFDTNWLGLPAEPWAFSGRLRSRLRVPRYEEVSFVYGRDSVADLPLRVWW